MLLILGFDLPGIGERDAIEWIAAVALPAAPFLAVILSWVSLRTSLRIAREDRKHDRIQRAEDREHDVDQRTEDRRQDQSNWVRDARYAAYADLLAAHFRLMDMTSEFVETGGANRKAVLLAISDMMTKNERLRLVATETVADCAHRLVVLWTEKIAVAMGSGVIFTEWDKIDDTGPQPSVERLVHPLMATAFQLSELARAEFQRLESDTQGV